MLLTMKGISGKRRARTTVTAGLWAAYKGSLTFKAPKVGRPKA